MIYAIYALAIALSWLVLSLVAALFFGRVIALRDHHQTAGQRVLEKTKQ